MNNILKKYIYLIITCIKKIIVLKKRATLLVNNAVYFRSKNLKGICF